jgi:hypothetical protein
MGVYKHMMIDFEDGISRCAECGGDLSYDENGVYCTQCGEKYTEYDPYDDVDFDEQ